MKCLVSRHITDLSWPVRFMYRESPDNTADSGWRFLSGFEDEAYINNADNIVMRDIGDILRLDPAVSPWLHCDAGMALERLGQSECFKPAS